MPFKSATVPLLELVLTYSTDPSAPRTSGGEPTDVAESSLGSFPEKDGLKSKCVNCVNVDAYVGADVLVCPLERSSTAKTAANFMDLRRARSGRPARLRSRPGPPGRLPYIGHRLLSIHQLHH